MLTIRRLQVADGAIFAFVADSSSTAKFSHLMEASTNFSSNPKLNRSMDMGSSNPKLHRRGSGSSCGYRLYHLTKNNSSNTIDSDQAAVVHVPEIYLTRLLTTKGTLQQVRISSSIFLYLDILENR